MCASTPSIAPEAGVRRWLLACLLLIVAAGAGCDGTPPDARPLTLLDIPRDCEPQRGCTVSGERVALQLQFDTPVRALQPFHLKLRTGGAETVEAVMVTFLMRGMDMGLNRYRLIGTPGGVWEGDVTLPVCVSGRSDWIAAFELITAARRYRLQVPFVVQK